MEDSQTFRWIRLQKSLEDRGWGQESWRSWKVHYLPSLVPQVAFAYHFQATQVKKFSGESTNSMKNRFETIRQTRMRLPLSRELFKWLRYFFQLGDLLRTVICLLKPFVQQLTSCSRCFFCSCSCGLFDDGPASCCSSFSSSSHSIVSTLLVLLNLSFKSRRAFCLQRKTSSLNQ